MRKSGMLLRDEPVPVEQKPPCRSTSVMPSQDIQVNGINHAGLVTHRCKLNEDKHTTDANGNDICECVCEVRWLKNYK